VREGILCAATLVALVPQAAGAASFDCAKATSPYDKLICAKPNLSAADEQITSAYGRARARLSAEGKRLMVEGQRSWVKYARESLSLEGVSGAAGL